MGVPCIDTSLKYFDSLSSVSRYPDGLPTISLLILCSNQARSSEDSRQFFIRTPLATTAAILLGTQTTVHTCVEAQLSMERYESSELGEDVSDIRSPFGNAHHLVLVFVTTDIPIKTINLLLHRSEQYDAEGCLFRILDTMDLDTITYANDVSRPVADDFVSPFLDWRHDQIRRWFVANLTDHQRPFFGNYVYLVLDKDTLGDQQQKRRGTTLGNAVGEAEELIAEPPVKHAENGEDDDVETALLCLVGSKQPKMVRCSFHIVRMIVVDISFMGRSIRDDPIAVFWRSGVTATKFAYEMVASDGIYFDRGVPEVNEKWRAWARSWEADRSSTEPSEDECEALI